jgi:hypothetical protein
MLLKDLAMVMSHDAATGYLTRTHVVADWTITQGADLVGQLDCGSRSFDYRPYYDADKDKVIAHHGGIKVDIEMGDAIDDVLSWSADNPNELVMFYINSCDGDAGCQDATKAVVDSKNIYSISECASLGSLTVEDIMKNAQIPENGGHVFALYDCVSQEYDSTVNCYGKDFTCYDARPKDTAQIPWDHMISYAMNTTAVDKSHGASYSPWMLQAHWQSTAGSITSGTLHRSSLLLDEERSDMNKWAADSIVARKFPTLSIVELDNVCNHGLDVYNALKDWNAEQAKK